MPPHPHTVTATPAPRAPAAQAASGRRRAFTMVELLVAVFITVGMMTVVAYLVSSTQRVTRMGLARAQMTQSALAMDSMLRADALALRGPNSKEAAPAGCLVIVNAVREGYVPLVNGRTSRKPVPLRCDQLVYCLDRANSYSPWTAGAASQSGGYKSAIATHLNAPTTRALQTKVWIGAVRDANVPPGGGGPEDPAMAAHRWLMGRQNKLLGSAADGTDGAGLSVSDDTSTATLTTLSSGATTLVTLPNPNPVRRRAYGGGWTVAQYLTNLANTPNSQVNYTNLPTVTPQVDIRAYQRSPVGAAAQAFDVTDLTHSHMRLLDNCSEIAVQWAGDLDKDGILDTYPPGHPLAGSIIWYPEELGSPTIPAGSRWHDTFPAGFATSTSRFNGRAYTTSTTGDGFSIKYPVTAPGAAAGSVPAPFVFRFEDDQYRTVRYGFRQDGSSYANKHDGTDMGFLDAALVSLNYNRHWFPYPPRTAANARTAALGLADADGWPVAGLDQAPWIRALYAGQAAPNGPYPRTAAAAVAAAAGVNFGDAMGDVFVGPAATDIQARKAATLGLVRDLENNHTTNYRDIFEEHLAPINDPILRETAEDWRLPQSDWPRLVRLRYRLHDARGEVYSDSDAFVFNGRDDDGDGLVDNPEERRAAGVWFEHVIAVPYPRDPSPNTHPRS